MRGARSFIVQKLPITLPECARRRKRKSWKVPVRVCFYIKSAQMGSFSYFSFFALLFPLARESQFWIFYIFINTSKRRRALKGTRRGSRALVIYVNSNVESRSGNIYIHAYEIPIVRGKIFRSFSDKRIYANHARLHCQSAPLNTPAIPRGFHAIKHTPISLFLSYLQIWFFLNI